MDDEFNFLGVGFTVGIFVGLLIYYCFFSVSIPDYTPSFNAALQREGWVVLDSKEEDRHHTETQTQTNYYYTTDPNTGVVTANPTYQQVEVEVTDHYKILTIERKE